MDDAPETRRRIGIVVSQKYREGRQEVKFSCVTPVDAKVSFSSYPDHSFAHLRKLHQKAVQAVVGVVDGCSQTEVRVPWSRWVETTPPDILTQDDEDMPKISSDVLHRIETGVKETGVVDVLSDDWGQLGLLDRSAALLLKPLSLPGRHTHIDEWEEEEGEVGDEEEEEEEGEEQSSPDILKLQMLQRKMMKRIHERRAAAAAAESPLQRFLRHYHKQLKILYPEEASKLQLDLPQQPQVVEEAEPQKTETKKGEKKKKKKKKDKDDDSIPSIEVSEEED